MSLQINRRRMLQGMGLSALATQGYAKHHAEMAKFSHGVASGDPLSDRVILWTRVVPAESGATLKVNWQVATDSGFKKVVALGSSDAKPERDYTVKVDAIGLSPGTSYFYRFTALGHHSPTGQTKTLPEGDVAEFKMGVASCSNYPQGFFNVYRHMADTDLDVVLHLGDYIYEYPEGGYANEYALKMLKRNVQPTHEILTLADYRTRYGLYRSDEDLQAVHQRHPFICVWDDHELTNNTWKAGAENHNEGEGDFDARMAAARQAYDEWMPIRTHASGDQGPIYRHFSIGKLADLLMLDTRLIGRDRGLEYGKDMIFQSDDSGSAGKQPDVEAFRRQRLENPDRQLLGAEQEQWLSASLEDSMTRGTVWQILGQQILMGHVGIPAIDDEALKAAGVAEDRRGYFGFLQSLGREGLPLNLDAWDGYPVARERVAHMLHQVKANTVVLAGDTHNAWAFNLSDEAGHAIGVEIGTPGVSSPGMENYIPIPAEQLAQKLKEASPGLVAVDTAQRGWSEVILTPQEMRNRWHYVSTILDRRFEVNTSSDLICKVGDRAFS